MAPVIDCSSSAFGASKGLPTTSTNMPPVVAALLKTVGV
jgi:hypothetical protein